MCWQGGSSERGAPQCVRSSNKKRWPLYRRDHALPLRGWKQMPELRDWDRTRPTTAPPSPRKVSREGLDPPIPGRLQAGACHLLKGTSHWQVFESRDTHSQWALPSRTLFVCKCQQSAEYFLGGFTWQKLWWPGAIVLSLTSAACYGWLNNKVLFSHI